MAVEDAKRCHKLPALSGETVFSTADTTSLAFLVWRNLVFPDASIQLTHGLPSGSSLQEIKNSFNFPRGSVTGADSSLVDAVLAVSGDKNVSSASQITSWPNVSEKSSKE